MAIHRAFDGQVIFDVHLFNLQAHIIYKRIYENRPKIEGDGLAATQTKILFDNFATFLACTTDIAFDLPEDADVDLLALRDFWQAAQNSNDYPALWDLFLRCVTLDISDTWTQVYREAQPRRLRVERELGNPERLTDEEKKIPPSSSDGGNGETVSAPRPG